MGRFKAKNVGKGATLITLLSNPVVRSVAIRAATQAANSASSYIESRSQKKKTASSTASSPAQGSSSRPVHVESQTKVIPPTPGTKTSSSAKPSSFADSAAVESIVSSITSAAKPVAEKMAATSAGRSVLEAINSLSGQALDSSSGPPKKAGAAVASFLGSILAGQEAKDPRTTQKGDRRFEADKPSPKSSNGSNDQ